ncbi:nesprin-2 [Stegostoma tigrinum]|uniref:nesprin-2 n=1 Tax=Stegostoma tigrinum TaxID=3053191 RepID=UPI0028705DD7|nr:nesprin-2 [Stegostoma tigrinum]
MRVALKGKDSTEEPKSTDEGPGRMLSAGPAPTSEQEEGADIDNVKCVLQAEHEEVQNRTFTNWVNAQLAKHETPSAIRDLFQDLQDGHRLLDLLEVLSGQQMVRERTQSNPIHWRSNITTALNFLRSKSVKLVNINVPDIVNGKPTIILGLIWSLIVYFQVEKLTSGLASRQSLVEPSPALNSSPAALSPQRGEAPIHLGKKMSARTSLLQWVQEKTEALGFTVQDFSSSWRNGLAFVAIINALRPGLLDLQELKQRPDMENLEMAFKVAEQELKIPRLLEAKDVAVSNPDEKSIITYISQFLQYSKEHAEAEEAVGTEALGAKPAQVDEGSVSEADVKRDFDVSRRQIEACIEGAMQFLKDRGSPQELIVKHQETIRRFDSGIYERFLEATDKIKVILTPEKKRIVDEMQAELCQNWEKVRSLVDLHLHQMKSEVEQNKFNVAHQECEAQLGMVSSHLQPCLEAHQVGTEALGAKPAQVDEGSVSEADVKRDFDVSRRQIEACIEGAMQFLKDRGSPQELIVKHQETIRRFDSGIYERFLEATDKIKVILTPEKKRIVDEMQAELCQNWEKVRSLVDLHLHQMKSEVEQNKFNVAHQECEAQLGMVSSHLQPCLEAHQVGTEALGAKPAQVDEGSVSEADVKRDFDVSRRQIEACIEGAMQFLKDRGSPQELIVKHQETIRRFDSGIYERFLEATDKIKVILTPEKKRIVDEMQAELCQNWEKVRSLVDLHLHQMKSEVEQNKFNVAHQECEAQLGMVSSHLQPCLEAHQMFFSEGSSLAQEQHLVAMRQLRDGNADAEANATLQSCEDCGNELNEWLCKLNSWPQDPVRSPGTGELQTNCQTEADLTEAATRNGPSQWAGRGADQADDLGSEDSPEPVTEVAQAFTQHRAAEHRSNILADTEANKIPGPCTEWIGIEDFGREGQTQSIQGTLSRNLQRDWLQRGACLPDGESPATMKGECPGQQYGVYQRLDTDPPDVNSARLLMQSSTSEGQSPDQPMGSHAHLVPISSRSQAAANDPGQAAKYLLMGKREMEMFPKVDVTHLGEELLSGQGKGETTHMGRSGLSVSAFPSEQHQDGPPTDGCFTQSQRGSSGQNVLVTALAEKPAPETFMVLSVEQQAKHQQTEAVVELGKECLTEDLSVTGRDRCEDPPLCVKVCLCEQGRVDKPTGHAVLKWPVAARDQSHITDTRERLFGRKQDESLTLCDKESLTGADQTDPSTMKDSVDLDGAIQREQEQAGEGQSEGNQTRIRELPAYGNPAFVTDQERTISAPTESTVQHTKEYSSGEDQAYGLPLEGIQKSPTVSVSEMEFTRDESRQSPAQLSTSSPVREDRPGYQTKESSGQFSELVLSSRDIDVSDLPGENSGQLLPASLSEEETHADLTTEDSAQSGRECLREKELNVLEAESIPRSEAELRSGKVQTLGPHGIDSTECQREGEHGDRMATGSSAPLMTMSLSAQLQGDSPAMEDSAAQSVECLSERGQADGPVSDVSPGAVTEPPSGEKQTEIAIAQDAVCLVRATEGQAEEIQESMSVGKLGEDLTVFEEESLIGTDQTDPSNMKDSVNVEEMREQKLTKGPGQGAMADMDEAFGLPKEDSDRLPISVKREDLTLPDGRPVTGAEQTITCSNVYSLDWERLKLREHEQTGGPGKAVANFPEAEGLTERAQAVTLLSVDSEPSQESLFIHNGAQAVIPSEEMFLREPPVAPEYGTSMCFVGEPWSQEEEERADFAESAVLFQIADHQTTIPERHVFPRRTQVPQRSKEMEDSAQSVSSSSNPERQLPADSAETLVTTFCGDHATQDEGVLMGKESVMTPKWPLGNFSQPQVEYLAQSNLAGDTMREDFWKPAHRTEQELAGALTSSLVDPGEKGQQDNGTQEEEDQSTADIGRQDHNINTRNELSERDSSLRIAFTALESVEKQILSLHSSLLEFQNKPKVLTGFNIKHEPELQMLKNLQAQVKSQTGSCEDLQSRLSETNIVLEPMDQCAVSAVATGHIQRCQEIGAAAQLTEEALLTLVEFLQLLRQEGASQDGWPRSEEEEETRLLQDRALELDKTLAAVKICLVDGSSGERTCCLDLVSSLGLEAAKLGLGRQPGVTQEELHQAFCTRQSHFIKDVQEIEKRAGALWLSEATFPGVQWRLRSLNDLDTELKSKASELRCLMEQLTVVNPALTEEAQELLSIAQHVFEETERNIHDRQDQCHVLMAFLREYQNYKKELTATIQKGAAVLPGHTSYMGKGKLQRLKSDINDVKREFDSQQGKVDKLRKVCRHLQSELKKVMNCNSLPFQAEAENLLDQWLDESERLDTYSCNLEQALSLWEDVSEGRSRLQEGVKGRLEAQRMSASAQELTMLEDEILSQEKEMQSFQEKAVRIQELLGWEEIPLELQVESTVKKRIEQVKHTNKQPNTMDKETTAHLGHSAAKHEPAGVPSESDGRQDTPPLSHNREGIAVHTCGSGVTWRPDQGALPAFEFKVEDQQHSPRALGGHEELLQGGEDPRGYSDDDVTPIAEELPETPRPQPERSQESGKDELHHGETEPRRRQREASAEETQAKRRRELWSVQTERDQDNQPAAKTPLHPQETKLEGPEKYPEKLREHVTSCQKLAEYLDSLETTLKASAAQIPTSYKAAIEQGEKQMALGREIDCIEQKVLELRDKAHDLEGISASHNEGSVSQAVSGLSEHWLRLRDSAREQELRCAGLREEWKSISEQIDRATIILDHLQDDLPDGLWEQAPMSELLALEESTHHYHDDLSHHQSALGVLFQRVAHILNGQEPLDPAASVPILQELQMMQDRCKSLVRKIEKNQQDIEEEVREREKTLREMNSIDDWLQQANSQLDNTELHCDGRPETDLEQLRAAANARRQAMAELSSQLRNRYSERDVPSGIVAHVQGTSAALTDVEAKLQALGPQVSASQDLSHRIVSVTAGLHSVEKMLQQCSKTHTEARSLQKKVWCAIDESHSVLSKLEAEVQELAQQDPGAAQRLMENLLEPLQLHQLVSHRAEHTTALLNKIPDCLEEYKQITDSTLVWNDSAVSLFSNKTDYTSAKTVSKLLLAFQVLAETGRQKQHGLQDAELRLKELSVLYDMEQMMKRLSELQKGISTLQQDIDQQLAMLEHAAMELGDLESEVKNIENKLSKVNTILSSINLCDLPIIEHLENRQIILENLKEMKELLGMMEQCKETLGIPQEAICTVEVFTKIQRLSVELARLQEVTIQQNTMLQSLLEKLQEYDTEMERLQQMGELYVGTQGESLASLTEQRESLLNNAQEAFTRLMQEEPKGEKLSDDSSREKQQTPTALNNLTTDSKVSADGKLPFLMEEDEEPEEDEDVVRSGERNQTPVPAVAPSLLLLEDLHMCQDQVAALQCWLDTVQESLGKCAGDQKMHRDVEEHLLQSRSALLEIEEKVCELAGAGQEGTSSIQPDLEILSHRLGSLKCSLVTFQAKLQDGQVGPAKEIMPADGAVCHTLPTGQPTSAAMKPKLSRQDSLQQQKELEVELVQHRHLTEYIALQVDRMNRQIHSSEEREAAEPISSPSTDTLQLTGTMMAEPPGVPSHSDRVAATWQCLQQEMEGRLKLLEDSLQQGLGSQLLITAGTVHSVHGISSPSPSPAAAEELSMLVTQLGQLAREAAAIPTQGQVGVNPGECVTSEKRLQDTTVRINQWIDAAEEGICSSNSIPFDEAEEQLEHHQLLAVTLEKVSAEMSEQCSVLEQPHQSAERISPLARQCLATLQSRLKLLQAAYSAVGQLLTARVREITQYQDRLRQFEAALLERRMKVRNQCAAQSTSDQLWLIEKMECDLEPVDAELLAMIAEGQQYDLETTATEDLCKLQEILTGIRACLSERWGQVQQTTLVPSQYERLLQALLGLVNDGQEKLSQGTRLLSKNIGDLQSQLQSHKLFFSRLANHLILVDQFSQNVPEFTITRNRDLWLELVEGVSALQARALVHGIRLETAAQAWSEFEVDHSSLMKELELLKSAVPTVGLVEETEERLSERVSSIQIIRSSLSGMQARVEQSLSSGQALLGVVSCPELGAQIHNLEESWFSLNNQVNHQLHRLEKLLEHCTRFQHQSYQVCQWLASARNSVSYWEQESVSLPSSPESSDNQLKLFLEFWKEVNGMSSPKSAVMSTGTQLLALKQAESGALRTHLAQLEQEWAYLVAQLPGIQEKLHQLQVTVLPSRQAIAQLTAWIQDAGSSMQENGPLTQPLDSSSRVKLLLQKYKDYQMEVNCRQLMVDFVNQSVLQMSSQDVESDRYERTEFAESLGALNFRWQRLTQDLSRKILDLEMLLESWTEYERSVKSVASWLEVQQDRLSKNREACSQTAIGKALTDCQELGEGLKVKEVELETLRQTVPQVIESGVPETPTSVTQKLDKLQDSRRQLDAEVSQLQSILIFRQQLWGMYQDSYEQINGNILKARYTLEHCTPLYSSLESAKIQLESLQTLQVRLEGGEESWRKFQEVSQNLRQECCPALAQQLDNRCDDTHSRWIHVQQEITEQLRSAGTLCHLWQQFVDHYHRTSATLRTLEERCCPLLPEISPEDGNLEKLQSRLTQTQESLGELRTLREEASQVDAAAEGLRRGLDASSSAALQANLHNLSGRASHLEALLSVKIPEIQGLMEQHEEFQQGLWALETLVNESEEVLKSNDFSPEKPEPFCLEILKAQTLRLSGTLQHLEALKRLSCRLPLDGLDYTRFQALNRRWCLARATAVDRCSKLQAIMLQEESFSQKCEHWRQFLERMEEALMIDVAGSYEGLKEQQKTHELFQAEASIAHQILDSIIQEAYHLIPSSDAQDRRTFVLNLSALKERWCRLVQKVWQRQHLITTLTNQWCRHGNSVARIRKLLTDTSNKLQAMGDLRSYSLHQLWMLLEGVKHQGRKLQQLEPRMMRALEVGKELEAAADSSTQASLQDQLCQLHDAWDSTNLQLTDTRDKLTNIIKMCDRCGEEVTVLGLKLQEFRTDLKRELPCSSEDLQKEQNKLQQELGGPMRCWVKGLAELSTVKVALGKYLIPDAVIGFQEQVAILESHWELLQLSASLRTLEISDQLEQWVVFNTKSKHLEDWLKQMEDRVSQSTDSGVEEMIERLQKDCMREINLYNRNKAQLKQLGSDLIKASSPSKASEIDNKLNLISRNWQHLLEVIEARVKKLKETLCSEQLLDKEMSNLRTWLSRIESELSKPVIYNICDDQEIEKKLAEQQELQRDIEQHSVGVTSVLSLCDSLLLDTDTESECDSIQQTTRSLDRRWRNICAMSVERRMKIEETWRLWQKFLDDYSRFDDWLKVAERTAAHPNSSQVLYSLAKEELKKFETFQRQIHESLTQLELINKQYRRLARENRTDSSSQLKQMVHEGNQRWDILQKRIAAILRRLKHFVNQREEFESCRECILVWLTEMDLQLTNVEHFSESDIDDKVRQLNAFQHEITLNTTKIDQLIVSGEKLIWKIEPMDAIAIEEELEELHAYCQEVFGRVARFHQRLMSKQPMNEEKEDLSDREADTDDGAELRNASWRDKADGSELSAQGALCQLTLPGEPQQHERSGGVTPVSVDSIPLEWDHTVDVGGSSSHEDEDDGLYFSNLSDVQITESPEACVKMTESTLRTSAGNVGPDAIPWHPAPSPEGSRRCQYQQTGIAIGQHVPSSGQSLDRSHGDSYASLQSDGSGNKVSARRAEISQQPELADSEQTPASIAHWRLLNAKALSEELVIKQNLQQWQQLNSDLDDISWWLAHIEPTLNQALGLQPSPQLAAIEEKLRGLQNIQKELDKYKALVISANLSSREFLQTDSAEAQELQAKLHQVNGNWNRTAQRLEQWRASLRSALTGCQDFHRINHSLVMWLAECERRRGLVQLSNPGLSLHTLTQHRKTLMDLEAEMLEKRPQVNTLQEISEQLLESGEGAACDEANEKVHVIGRKLKLLLGEITADLQTVNERLDVGSVISADELDFPTAPMGCTPLPPQVDRREVRMDRAAVPSSTKRFDGEVVTQAKDVSKAGSFLSRVLRVAVPLQLLILLLLLLACLVPFTQEDYNCALANNFARSLYPMLRYTNGPPPT